MVWVVPCKDKSEYEMQLSSVVTSCVHRDEIITLIDCRNSVHQYLFDPNDLDAISSQLFVSRIERLHDFIDQLERIGSDPYFKKSDVLVISDYTYLLADISERQHGFLIAKVVSMLKRLEQRHNISVIVLDINSQWDTPYHQSGRSYIAN